jgi:hypothetical protein
LQWLNGEIHIYFNGQEINFAQLENKPAETGYKIHHLSKDHPWRRTNQEISDDKLRDYSEQV